MVKITNIYFPINKKKSEDFIKFKKNYSKVIHLNLYYYLILEILEENKYLILY